MYESEPTTVMGWQNGDEYAVRAIFNIYYPRAVRLAVLSGLKPEEAQDCAQEAFLLAFERRHQLRNPVAFSLWFHRIITHHILDFIRASNRGKEVPLKVAAELTEDQTGRQAKQPDEIAITAEGSMQLWKNVQKLAPHYRIPLVLRYYGDFSLREIAKMMDKREGTIRVIIHRALYQLRLLSKDELDEEISSNTPLQQIAPTKIY